MNSWWQKNKETFFTSEFLTELSLYHIEPTFKRSRNFCDYIFFYFQFYPLLRCDFLTHQNQTGHFLWIAKSLQTQRSIWAGARFPSARQRMCAPKHHLILSNTLSYHTETSSGQKSDLQTYTTHEAIFQKIWPTLGHHIFKNHFQIPVDEFEVIKK